MGKFGWIRLPLRRIVVVASVVLAAASVALLGVGVARATSPTPAPDPAPVTKTTKSTTTRVTTTRVTTTPRPAISPPVTHTTTRTTTPVKTQQPPATPKTVKPVKKPVVKPKPHVKPKPKPKPTTQSQPTTQVPFQPVTHATPAVPTAAGVTGSSAGGGRKFSHLLILIVPLLLLGLSIVPTRFVVVRAGLDPSSLIALLLSKAA